MAREKTKKLDEKSMKLFHGWLAEPNQAKGAFFRGKVLGCVWFSNPDGVHPVCTRFYVDSKQEPSKDNFERTVTLEGTQIPVVSEAAFARMKADNKFKFGEGQAPKENQTVQEKITGKVNRPLANDE